LFEGLQEVIIKAVERSLDQKTVAIFDETEKLFEEQLEKLRASLAAVDPPLADALKGGKENILSNLSRLRLRFVNNQSKRDETTRSQIERTFTVLYPNKGLQEREINVTYFLARYGYELIDRVYEEVDVESPDHKLVYRSSDRNGRGEKRRHGNLLFSFSPLPLFFRSTSSPGLSPIWPWCCGRVSAKASA